MICSIVGACCFGFHMYMLLIIFSFTPTYISPIHHHFASSMLPFLSFSLLYFISLRSLSSIIFLSFSFSFLLFILRNISICCLLLFHKLWNFSLSFVKAIKPYLVVRPWAGYHNFGAICWAVTMCFVILIHHYFMNLWDYDSRKDICESV